MLLLFSAVLKTFLWARKPAFFVVVFNSSAAGVPVSIGILGHENRPSSSLSLLYGICHKCDTARKCPSGCVV